MHSTSDQVYNKFKTVANAVKEELKRKGMAIPVKNQNGTITLETFTILKNHAGFYEIKDRRGDVVVSGINLPQTAALLANGLALGRWLDEKIYNLDREYGYRLFESDLLKKNATKNLKKNNVDRAEMLFTKFSIEKSKVDTTKREIVSCFEKLRNLH